jgi:hypothetical protein
LEPEPDPDPDPLPDPSSAVHCSLSVGQVSSVIVSPQAVSAKMKSHEVRDVMLIT